MLILSKNKTEVKVEEKRKLLCVKCDECEKIFNENNKDEKYFKIDKYPLWREDDTETITLCDGCFKKNIFDIAQNEINIERKCFNEEKEYINENDICNYEDVYIENELN